MTYDLSALVYVMIAVILVLKFFVGSCGAGTCT
jgi:hypothetical protein